MTTKPIMNIIEKWKTTRNKNGCGQPRHKQQYGSRSGQLVALEYTRLSIHTQFTSTFWSLMPFDFCIKKWLFQDKYVFFRRKLRPDLGLPTLLVQWLEVFTFKLWMTVRVQQLPFLVTFFMWIRIVQQHRIMYGNFTLRITRPILEVSWDSQFFLTWNKGK